MKTIKCLALLLATAASPIIQAEGKTFGFSGKSLDDPNFVAAFHGFEAEAKKHGDSAIHIGAKGPEHFRKQEHSLAAALTKKLDGIAISVTNSDWLANNVMPDIAAKHIPVVTFDSDFESKHKAFRKSFIGPDNVEIGRDLAKLAKQFASKGGTVWLMTGGQNITRQNPNLSDRLTGVRQELSGNNKYPQFQALRGEGGWKEPERSPWYTYDDNSVALKQVRLTASTPEVDVLIAVGHWPVMDTAALKQALASANRKGKKLILIAAVGDLTPERRELLNEHWVDGFVALNFEEMGRLSYQSLQKLSEGQRVPERVSQKNLIFVGDAKWEH